MWLKIISYVHLELNIRKTLFSLWNRTTLNCGIFSNIFFINYCPTYSIAEILRFSQRVLKPNQRHSSDLPVNIIKLSTIYLDANVTSGNIYNDKRLHMIYEFAVGVDPDVAIVETPLHLFCIPILNRSEIQNIFPRILDQDSDLLNFRREEIIFGLKLKQFTECLYLTNLINERRSLNRNQ